MTSVGEPESCLGLVPDLSLLWLRDECAWRWYHKSCLCLSCCLSITPPKQCVFHCLVKGQCPNAMVSRAVSKDDWHKVARCRTGGLRMLTNFKGWSPYALCVPELISLDCLDDNWILAVIFCCQLSYCQKKKSDYSEHAKLLVQVFLKIMSNHVCKVSMAHVIFSFF